MIKTEEEIGLLRPGSKIPLLLVPETAKINQQLEEAWGTICGHCLQPQAECQCEN